jgi:putative ABC transport system permease protein
VQAHDTLQRRKEIAIRIAVGATRESVVKMLLRQSARRAVIGIAVGIGGAAVLSRLLGSLLFDIAPVDVSVYVAVSLLLSVFVLVAGCVPVIRLVMINPWESLGD